MYTTHTWLHTTLVVEFGDIKQCKSASVATNMSNFWHSKTLLYTTVSQNYNYVAYVLQLLMAIYNNLLQNSVCIQCQQIIWYFLQTFRCQKWYLFSPIFNTVKVHSYGCRPGLLLQMADFCTSIKPSSYVIAHWHFISCSALQVLRGQYSISDPHQIILPGAVITTHPHHPIPPSTHPLLICMLKICKFSQLPMQFNGM